MRGVGAAALVALFVVPSSLMAVIVAAIFWLSFALSGPFHFRLWGAMYPARSLGRVMGVLGMTRAGAGAAAAIGGGILADRIGGSQAVALVGIVGVACAIGYAGFRATAHAAAPMRFSARESVRAMRERPRLLRLVIGQLFYGGGVIAASPLFALVHVDRLHLSLADVGVIGVITAISNTVAFPLWGLFSDRRGPSQTLALGSALGVVSLLAYALAPGVDWLWLAALAGGAASGAIDLGINAAVSAETPMASRAAAMAGWNAVTGARGIVAAFLMSVLMRIGLVDVTGALLLSALASTIGVALFTRAGRTAGATTAAVEPAASPRPVAALEASG
jgi:nitrate/nitrite transporter NarK